MLSEALRLIRIFHDMKQSELAEKLALSKSYLSELESGKKTPTVDVIEKYAAEFKIPVSSIFFFSENLADADKTDAVANKARGAIAGKVLNFLKFIERRTADETDAEETQIS